MRAHTRAHTHTSYCISQLSTWASYSSIDLLSGTNQNGTTVIHSQWLVQAYTHQQTANLLVAVVRQEWGIGSVACLLAPLIGIITRLELGFVELFKASLHTLSGEACVRVWIPALLDGVDDSVDLLQGEIGAYEGRQRSGSMWRREKVRKDNKYHTIVLYHNCWRHKHCITHTYIRCNEGTITLTTAE